MVKWVLLGALGLLFLAAFGTALLGGNVVSEANGAAERVNAACAAAGEGMAPDAFVGLATQFEIETVQDRRASAPEGSGFVIELVDGGFRDVTRCVATFDGDGVLQFTEVFRAD